MLQNQWSFLDLKSGFNIIFKSVEFFFRDFSSGISFLQNIQRTFPGWIVRVLVSFAPCENKIDNDARKNNQNQPHKNSSVTTVSHHVAPTTR